MFFNKAISPLLLTTASIILFSLPFCCSEYVYGNHTQEKPIGELGIGKPTEREIAGGQVHRYRLILSGGEYSQIVVEQRGIDVEVAVFDPEGKEICKVDSPNGTQGSEVLYLIAKSPGSYRLEVNASNDNSTPGQYRAKIEALRIATPQDHSLVAGQELFAEGAKLESQATAESRQAAIGKYQEALRYLQDVTAPSLKANVLHNLGNTLFYLGERKRGLDAFLQELSLRRAIGDLGGQGGALNNIGLVYDNTGDKQKAIDHYNQSLPLIRAAGDSGAEALVLNNIGLAYNALGDKQKALDYYNQSLPLIRAAGDRRGEALVLSNIGLSYKHLGEMEKALDHYRQSLRLRQEIADRGGEGVTLNNICALYQSLGEMQKALDYCNKSLQLRKVVGDRDGEATTLNNIGSVYYSLGEKEKALDFYRQSLPISQAVGDRNGEASTLINLGSIYEYLGEKQKAIDYYNKSLRLSRAIGSRNQEAVAISNIGNTLYSLGDRQAALDCYSQSLQLRRDVGDKHGTAIVLNSIGLIHVLMGDEQKALEHLDPALEIFRAVSNPDGEASALYNLARLERQRGNLIEARSQIEKSLGIFESLRAKVDVYELRASYFATVRDYYEFYIDLLVDLHKQDPSAGHDAAAFEVGERARARSLLETLSEVRADIRQGVDPQLLERERTLQRQLNAMASAQTALLAGKHTAAQAEALATQIDALTTQLREVKTEIRKSSPRYAVLTQPQPLKASEIQKQVLDQDTLLLEYFLGRKQSYLWAVTPVSITIHRLPPQAEIENVAREINNLLTARSLGPDNARAGRRVSTIEVDYKYRSQAASLSNMLLGPVGSQLGKKRLVIVADGALQYVPFAALPMPWVQNNEDQKSEVDPRPLIVDHEIISLPSASTLAALRQETAGRIPAEKSLAVLADPVFTKNDSRVRRSEIKVANQARAQSGGSDDSYEAYQEMTRSGQETGAIGAEPHFGRLLSTRHEAAAILALVPERERKQALDFEASRATALSSELSQYRIVHFATHGLLNNIHPDLSGIVLSLVDKRGDSQNGFLRLHEIYNLKLPAELVVLSACRTGLGKEVKGEGLIGLTRGFMYAGAPRIVATLWKVDDRATSELMKRFYQGLLGPERLRPAEALREAQLSIQKQKQWRAPYYWAAFVLQGEWK